MGSFAALGMTEESAKRISSVDVSILQFNRRRRPSQRSRKFANIFPHCNALITVFLLPTSMAQAAHKFRAQWSRR